MVQHNNNMVGYDDIIIWLCCDDLYSDKTHKVCDGGVVMKI